MSQGSISILHLPFIFLADLPAGILNAYLAFLLSLCTDHIGPDLEIGHNNQDKDRENGIEEEVQIEKKAHDDGKDYDSYGAVLFCRALEAFPDDDVYDNDDKRDDKVVCAFKV